MPTLPACSLASLPSPTRLLSHHALVPPAQTSHRAARSPLALLASRTTRLLQRTKAASLELSPLRPLRAALVLVTSPPARKTQSRTAIDYDIQNRRFNAPHARRSTSAPNPSPSLNCNPPSPPAQSADRGASHSNRLAEETYISEMQCHFHVPRVAIDICRWICLVYSTFEVSVYSTCRSRARSRRGTRQCRRA